jgi:L-aspartate oxidase
VHGANRLASNSLLEAVVFAARAAEDIKGSVTSTARLPAPDSEAVAPLPATPSRETELRELMAARVGVMRDGKGLARALATITRIEREAPSPALKNMATAALMVAAAAYDRRESRGAHFRHDYPTPDEAQAHRTMLTLERARRIAEDAAQIAQPMPVAAF